MGLPVPSHVNPSTAILIGNAVAYTSAIGFIAFCVIKSVPTSRSALRSTPRVQLAALASYLGCLAAVIWCCAAAFVLETGKHGERTCRIDVLGISFMYLIAKICMYYFYLERAMLSYILTERQTVVVYRSANCFFATVSTIMFIVTGFNHHTRIYEGHCAIDMSVPKTIFSLVVDGIGELSLTAIFLYPVWKAKFPAARALAIRSCIASATTFVATISVFCLTIKLNHMMNVWEYDGCWVCLLVLNSAIIFILTHRSQTPLAASPPPTTRHPLPAEFPTPYVVSFDLARTGPSISGATLHVNPEVEEDGKDEGKGLENHV